MGASQENEREKARQRARALMFKKPVCSDMSFENINTRLMEMQDEAADIDGMLWDDDTLEELLGDEEQAFEFKNAFRDLMSDLDSMREALNSLGDLMYMDDGDAEATFDLFFPAAGGDGTQLYGYDEYVSDYIPLDSWETQRAEEEAGKKLRRLTKDQILETAGVCLRIARQYLALQYRHDCLSAAFDIIKGRHEGLLQLVKYIDETYDLAEKETDGFKYMFGDAVHALDRALSGLPERLWTE